MDEQILIDIKKGAKLTPGERTEFDQSKAREWQIKPVTEQHLSEIMVVFIKDSNGKILAQGEVRLINGVKFNGELFNLLGVSGIIANVKGKGYGKKVIEAIIKYGQENKKSLLGFTGNNVITFYEKCGLLKDQPSLKRFVHIMNGDKRRNTTEDVVFYLDSEDQFMEKVLASPDLEVYLPRNPDW